MKDINQQIREFFDAYQNRFNNGLAEGPDVKSTTDAFADCFIEASPAGIQCAKNDARFRETIPKGYEFYKSIGTRSMKIDKLDITLLDEFHYMAKVYWLSSYEKNGGDKVFIPFQVIYFLQYANDSLKIFAYITGDEQAALREKGLIGENMLQK